VPMHWESEQLVSYDVWTCQQRWWLVQLQLSEILPMQSLMHSHKWMIKGSSGVVRRSLAVSVSPLLSQYDC
jgi:hypothetical protein